MNDQPYINCFNIKVPITGSELTVSVRGDFHYGVNGICEQEMIQVFKDEQEKNKDIFTIYTGDLIENNLKSSVGHGYDLKVKDPSIQKETMTNALIEVNKHLYGSSFNKVKLKTNSLIGCKSVGCIGNHEFRSRKEAGLWIMKEIYEPAKILDLGMNGLVNIEVVNNKLKLSKTYTLFIAHRPFHTNATTVESIIRACRKKRGDVPADVYIYGHFHRGIIIPEVAYDPSGRRKKVLYVVNPSPIEKIEYADWAGYSPLESSWTKKFYLPLDPFKDPYGTV